MTDLTAEFISFYHKLPKQTCLCRIFERSDSFFLYGEDAKMVNQILPAVKIKSMQSDEDELSYVKIHKGYLICTLRHLLFILQYKIEIYRNKAPGRSASWVVVGKASPGNLSAVEDLLIADESYVMTQKGVMAIKTTNEANQMVFGIAYCDLVLRELQICQFVDNPQLATLQSTLAQLSPQECLLPAVPKSRLSEVHVNSNVEEALKMHKISISHSGDFNSQHIVQDLNRLLRFEEGQDFNNSKKDESEMKVALSSLAAVIKYLELMTDEINFGQFNLSVFHSELFAKVDLSCELGLGLFPSDKSNFHDKSHLFGHLNSCCTGSGERLLIQWIKQPLMDIRKLEERLDIVESFVSDIGFQLDIRRCLDKLLDTEVFCRKIQRRKATLQDLYKVYQMLQRLPSLKESLEKYDGSKKDVLKINFIEELQERILDFENFITMISETIDLDAVQNREFIVKADYDEDLLECKENMDKLKRSMESEFEKVKNDLGISTVKLEMSDKMGYTFRVTLKEENHLRNRSAYTVLDTRNSGVRFLSSRLKELSAEHVAFKADYEKKQENIVQQIVEVSASYVAPLKQLGATIAWLDAALSLAKVATNAPKPYVRPKLIPKGDNHIILKQCRHPFLEDKLPNYIPNDVEITKDKHTFYFVTGPNMGGKSTFIRSVALNVLLAQMGCFVPCDEAEISLVDGFFTRIGACDKPSKAMSTFMYEMLEVKQMIKCATSSSLLVIDEMGRGTSTFDGFALSWEISKHIAEEIGSSCLFATHFHDLTLLSKSASCVGNLHVDALCQDGEVTFLYQVKPGVCSESFGIHVARMADFPEAVIKKAEDRLKELEVAQTSMDEITKPFSNVPGGEKVIKFLKDLFPDSVSDENDADTSTMDLDFDSESNADFDVAKAQELLKVLQELEAKYCPQ